MRSKQNINNTLIISIALAAFLSGLVFSRFGAIVHVSWVILSGTFLVFSLVKKKKSKAPILLSLTICMLTFGWWRGAQAFKRLDTYNALAGQTVVLKATALEDSVYSKRGQLMFVVGKIESTKPFRSKLIGEMDIEGRGTSMVYRGDTLEIQGKLFKKRGGQVAGVSFANIKTLSRNSSPIDTVRRNFVAGMQNSLPEPLASFGLGLLIGQRNTLSESLTNELIAVGLIHIVAVSGYNLTIIINAVQHIFKSRSRFQTLCFALSLIILFLLFTGYSPSIVRAAFVSSLALTAWYFGRKFNPLLLLLLVASITAGINPLLIWSNIGWYLSFTAFFGVLVIAPLFKKRFISKKNQEKILPSILSETLSAQLCTIPIILFIFGRLSVISIVANVLVVPLVPIAMLLSLVAGISGMVNFAFDKILVLPAMIILEYMLSVSNLLSRIPYANIEAKISAQYMIALYAIIVIVTVTLFLKTTKKYDTITDTRSSN